MCQSCNAFLDKLFDKGLLIETGVDGLYGRSGLFEEIIAGFERLITDLGGPDDPEVVRFPPGIARALFEKSGYLNSFPQLAGTIHSFEGRDGDHLKLQEAVASGRDWSEFQKMTDIVLTPAACYPLYPTIARRGALPKGGKLFDLQSYCFRHEPSKDPARQQFFRMREYVRIGSPDEVTEFRQTWLERGERLIKILELPYHLDIANDPFFGRAGKLLANNQRDQRLKFELLVPIEGGEANPTACLSFNYHQDHFGSKWGLAQANGDVAHTACVGFGLERVALGLLKHHGVDVAAWPASVRKAVLGR
jgi:seryl-tRNA synthetase